MPWFAYEVARATPEGQRSGAGTVVAASGAAVDAVEIAVIVNAVGP